MGHQPGTLPLRPCEACGKHLDPGRRQSARFCPGSRCRNAGRDGNTDRPVSAVTIVSGVIAFDRLASRRKDDLRVLNLDRVRAGLRPLDQLPRIPSTKTRPSLAKRYPRIFGCDSDSGVDTANTNANDLDVDEYDDDDLNLEIDDDLDLDADEVAERLAARETAARTRAAVASVWDHLTCVPKAWFVGKVNKSTPVVDSRSNPWSPQWSPTAGAEYLGLRARPNELFRMDSPLVIAWLEAVATVRRNAKCETVEQATAVGKSRKFGTADPGWQYSLTELRELAGDPE